MPVKSRKEQQSAATRAALIRVARKLFAEHGYAATPTDEIVRRARVTRGALYHHFRDKQDLFKAVFLEEQEKLAHMIAKAPSASAGPWERLIVGSQAFLDACLEPAVQQIVLLDAPSVLGWDGWREIDASFYLGGIKAGLLAAIDAGVIEPQPVDALAHVVFGALNEAAMLIAHSDDEAAARREVSVAIDCMFAGLRAPRGR